MQNKEEFKRETEIYFEFFIFPKICSICKKKIFLKDGVKIVDKSNEAKTQTTDYYCEECIKSSKDFWRKTLVTDTSKIKNTEEKGDANHEKNDGTKAD